MKITRYWKAVIAGLMAGGSALGTAAQDGTITGGEGLTIGAAVILAVLAVWRVPNKQPSTPPGA